MAGAGGPASSLHSWAQKCTHCLAGKTGSQPTGHRGQGLAGRGRAASTVSICLPAPFAFHLALRYHIYLLPTRPLLYTQPLHVVFFHLPHSHAPHPSLNYHIYSPTKFPLFPHSPETLFPRIPAPLALIHYVTRRCL